MERGKETFFEGLWPIYRFGLASVTLWVSLGLCGWKDRQGTEVGSLQLIQRRFYYCHVVLFFLNLSESGKYGNWREGGPKWLAIFFHEAFHVHIPLFFILQLLQNNVSHQHQTDCWLLSASISLNSTQVHPQAKHREKINPCHSAAVEGAPEA